MKPHTMDKLKCVLDKADIELLERNGYNPYKYKLIDKNAVIKTFQDFDEIEHAFSFRW